MPTYEFKCDKCEEIFEIFQKMTDAPLRECLVCGGKLTKVISGGIGIIFKGSGFYTTDSKNSSVGSSSSVSKTNGKENGKEKEKDEKKSTDSSTVSTK